MNEAYAEQIARQWNATGGNNAGFVTRFGIDSGYVEQFAEQVVGAEAVHRELWVPAEQLDEFNSHIESPIEVLSVWYGPAYSGPKGERGLLQGLNAREQPDLLGLLDDADFASNVEQNRCVVQVNLVWWAREIRHGLAPRLAPWWPPEWEAIRPVAYSK
jgi:hypothetical protein